MYEGTLELLHTISVSEASQTEMRLQSCVERALCVCLWGRINEAYDNTERNGGGEPMELLAIPVDGIQKMS